MTIVTFFALASSLASTVALPSSDSSATTALGMVAVAARARAARAKRIFMVTPCQFDERFASVVPYGLRRRSSKKPPGGGGADDIRARIDGACLIQRILRESVCECGNGLVEGRGSLLGRKRPPGGG